MVKYENSLKLFTQDIFASRAARYFFQKSKIIYIEKSKRWVQPGSGSFDHLETANKTKLFLKIQNLLQNERTRSYVINENDTESGFQNLLQKYSVKKQVTWQTDIFNIMI